MKHNRLLFLSLLFVASQQLAARPFTLYVAPNGNDQWTGQLANPARNRKDGPLVTLPAALSAARTARQKNPTRAKDGITIFLRGGEHVLNAPVNLTPDDSGASEKRH